MRVLAVLFNPCPCICNHMLGDKRSYLTHCSTVSKLLWSNPRASSPTHTRSMDMSPDRTDLKEVVLDPNFRRMGRELNNKTSQSVGHSR